MTAVADQEIGHVAAHVIAREDAARLDERGRAEGVVEPHRQILKCVRPRARDEIDIRAPCREHDAGAAARKPACNGRSGADHGDFGRSVPGGIGGGARRELERGRSALAECRRADAGVEVGCADRLGLNGGDGPGRVHRIEEWQSVEVHPRIAPARAPSPELRRKVIAGRDARESLEGAQDIRLTHGLGLEQVGGRQAAHVTRQIATLAVALHVHPGQRVRVRCAYERGRRAGNRKRVEQDRAQYETDGEAQPARRGELDVQRGGSIADQADAHLIRAGHDILERVLSRGIRDRGAPERRQVNARARERPAALRVENRAADRTCRRILRAHHHRSSGDDDQQAHPRSQIGRRPTGPGHAKITPRTTNPAFEF